MTFNFFAPFRPCRMRAVCAGTFALILQVPAPAIQIGDYLSYTTEGNAVVVSCGQGQKARITVCTPGIIKVEFDPSGAFTATKSDLMTADFALRDWPASNFSVTDESYLKIQTERLTIRVQKSPFRVLYFDAANTTQIGGDHSSRGMAVNENPWLRLSKTPTEHFFGWATVKEVYSSTFRRLDKLGTSNVGKSFMCEAPFMYSTGGYGIFCLFDALGTDADEIPQYDLRNAEYADYYPSGKHPGDYLAYYFIYGPDWRTVIDGYTQISGRPQILAKKWYGVQRDWFDFSRQLTMDDFKNYADKMRQGKFPCDVVRMDAMYDWGLAGRSECPQELIDLLKHYKDNGFIFGGMVGTKKWETPVWPGSFVAPTAHDLETVEQAKIAVDHGFEFAWFDKVMYGHSYHTAQQMHETWKQARNGDESMVFVSKGWYSACSQSFMGAHTGDKLDDAGYWNVFPGALEQHLAGYHVSCTDIGESSDWNYIGTAMRPVVAFHQEGAAGCCWKQTTEVWNYSATIQEVIRKWGALHYRFIPYFFTYGMKAHETGMPVWRHMMCHDPQNSRTWNLDRQAWVGEEIIISPYYDDGDGSSGVRSGIWLPGGVWYDFFTGTKYDGNATVDYPVDPDGNSLNKLLPMFVKEGSILPLMEPMQFVGEKPETLITLSVWPSLTTQGTFTLYEDETPVITQLSCDHNQNQTSVHIGPFAGSRYCPDPAQRSYAIELNTPVAPKKVAGGPGEPVELTALGSKAEFDAAAHGWFYDPAARKGVCYVKPAGNAALGFSVYISYNGQIGVSREIQQGARLSRINLIPHNNGTAVMSFDGAGAMCAELLDAQGKKVWAFRSAGPGSTSIPLSSFGRGMYVLKAEFDKGVRLFKLPTGL